MLTDGALHRRLRALADVAAVEALPDDLLIALEHRALIHLLQQQLVAGVVLLLDLADGVEETRNLVESLLARDACELGVHARPLLILPGGGIGEVRLRVADTVHEFEPDLCVCLLVDCRLVEDVRDLDVAILLRLRRIVEILRMRLRFAGKCRPEVLLGL